MGTFRVDIEVGDPAGTQFRPLHALVDTGSTYLQVPRPVLESLGISPVERRPFVFADGRTQESDVGVVALRLQGRTLPCLCVFGEPASEALLGAVALETFMVAPDPVGQALVPVPGLRMSQTGPLITPEEVEHVAMLARLGLTDEEKATLQTQLSSILEYMQALSQVDTSAIPPTAQVIPLQNVMRPDEPRPSLSKEEVMANAPDRDGDFFRFPPVLE